MRAKKPASKTNFAKLDVSEGVPDEESPEVTAQDLARATFSIGNVVIRGPRKPKRRAGRPSKRAAPQSGRSSRRGTAAAMRRFAKASGGRGREAAG